MLLHLPSGDKILLRFQKGLPLIRVLKTVPRQYIKCKDCQLNPNGICSRISLREIKHLQGLKKVAPRGIFFESVQNGSWTK